MSAIKMEMGSEENSTNSIMNVKYDSILDNNINDVLQMDISSIKTTATVEEITEDVVHMNENKKSEEITQVNLVKEYMNELMVTSSAASRNKKKEGIVVMENVLIKNAKKDLEKMKNIDMILKKKLYKQWNRIELQDMKFKIIGFKIVCLVGKILLKYVFKVSGLAVIALSGYFTPAAMTSYFGKYLLFGFLESSGLVSQLDIYKIKNLFIGMYNEYNNTPPEDRVHYFDIFTKLLTNSDTTNSISASSPKLNELYNALHQVLGNKFINLNAQSTLSTGLQTIISPQLSLFSMNEYMQMFADASSIYDSYVDDNTNSIKHEYSNMKTNHYKRLIGHTIGGVLTSETFKGLTGGTLAQILNMNDSSIMFSFGSDNFPIGVFNKNVGSVMLQMSNGLYHNAVMNFTGTFFANPDQNMDKNPVHKLTLSQQIDIYGKYRSLNHKKEDSFLLMENELGLIKDDDTDAAFRLLTLKGYDIMKINWSSVGTVIFSGITVYHFNNIFLWLLNPNNTDSIEKQLYAPTSSPLMEYNALYKMLAVFIDVIDSFGIGMSDTINRMVHQQIIKFAQTKLIEFYKSLKIIGKVFYKKTANLSLFKYLSNKGNRVAHKLYIDKVVFPVFDFVLNAIDGSFNQILHSFLLTIPQFRITDFSLKFLHPTTVFRLLMLPGEISNPYKLFDKIFSLLSKIGNVELLENSKPSLFGSVLTKKVGNDMEQIDISDFVGDGVLKYSYEYGGSTFRFFIKSIFPIYKKWRSLSGEKWGDLFDDTKVQGTVVYKSNEGIIYEDLSISTELSNDEKDIVGLIAFYVKNMISKGKEIADYELPDISEYEGIIKAELKNQNLALPSSVISILHKFIKSGGDIAEFSKTKDSEEYYKNLYDKLKEKSGSDTILLTEFMHYLEASEARQLLGKVNPLFVLPQEKGMVIDLNIFSPETLKNICSYSKGNDMDSVFQSDQYEKFIKLKSILDIVNMANKSNHFDDIVIQFDKGHADIDINENCHTGLKNLFQLNSDVNVVSFDSNKDYYSIKESTGMSLQELLLRDKNFKFLDFNSMSEESLNSYYIEEKSTFRYKEKGEILHHRVSVPLFDYLDIVETSDYLLRILKGYSDSSEFHSFDDLYPEDSGKDIILPCSIFKDNSIKETELEKIYDMDINFHFKENIKSIISTNQKSLQSYCGDERETFDIREYLKKSIISNAKSLSHHIPDQIRKLKTKIDEHISKGEIEQANKVKNILMQFNRQMFSYIDTIKEYDFHKTTLSNEIYTNVMTGGYTLETSNIISDSTEENLIGAFKKREESLNKNNNWYSLLLLNFICKQFINKSEETYTNGIMHGNVEDMHKTIKGSDNVESCIATLPKPIGKIVSKIQQQKKNPQKISLSVIDLAMLFVYAHESDLIPEKIMRSKIDIAPNGDKDIVLYEYDILSAMYTDLLVTNNDPIDILGGKVTGFRTNYKPTKKINYKKLQKTLYENYFFRHGVYSIILQSSSIFNDDAIRDKFEKFIRSLDFAYIECIIEPTIACNDKLGMDTDTGNNREAIYLALLQKFKNDEDVAIDIKSIDTTVFLKLIDKNIHLRAYFNLYKSDTSMFVDKMSDIMRGSYQNVLSTEEVSYIDQNKKGPGENIMNMYKKICNSDTSMISQAIQYMGYNKEHNLLFDDFNTIRPHIEELNDFIRLSKNSEYKEHALGIIDVYKEFKDNNILKRNFKAIQNDHSNDPSKLFYDKTLSETEYNDGNVDDIQDILLNQVKSVIKSSCTLYRNDVLEKRKLQSTAVHTNLFTVKKINNEQNIKFHEISSLIKSVMGLRLDGLADTDEDIIPPSYEYNFQKTFSNSASSSDSTSMSTPVMQTTYNVYKEPDNINEQAIRENLLMGESIGNKISEQETNQEGEDINEGEDISEDNMIGEKEDYSFNFSGIMGFMKSLSSSISLVTPVSSNQLSHADLDVDKPTPQTKTEFIKPALQECIDVSPLWTYAGKGIHIHDSKDMSRYSTMVSCNNPAVIKQPINFVIESLKKLIINLFGIMSAVLKLISMFPLPGISNLVAVVDVIVSNSTDVANILIMSYITKYLLNKIKTTTGSKNKIYRLIGVILLSSDMYTPVIERSDVAKITVDTTQATFKSGNLKSKASGIGTAIFATMVRERIKNVQEKRKKELGKELILAVYEDINETDNVYNDFKRTYTSNTNPLNDIHEKYNVDLRYDSGNLANIGTSLKSVPYEQISEVLNLFTDMSFSITNVSDIGNKIKTNVNKLVTIAFTNDIVMQYVFGDEKDNKSGKGKNKAILLIKSMQAEIEENAIYECQEDEDCKQRYIKNKTDLLVTDFGLAFMELVTDSCSSLFSIGDIIKSDNSNNKASDTQDNINTMMDEITNILDIRDLLEEPPLANDPWFIYAIEHSDNTEIIKNVLDNGIDGLITMNKVANKESYADITYTPENANSNNNIFPGKYILINPNQYQMHNVLFDHIISLGNSGKKKILFTEEYNGSDGNLKELGKMLSPNHNANEIVYINLDEEHKDSTKYLLEIPLKGVKSSAMNMWKGIVYFTRERQNALISSLYINKMQRENIIRNICSKYDTNHIQSCIDEYSSDQSAFTELIHKYAAKFRQYSDHLNKLLFTSCDQTNNADGVCDILKERFYISRKTESAEYVTTSDSFKEYKSTNNIQDAKGYVSNTRRNVMHVTKLIKENIKIPKQYVLYDKEDSSSIISEVGCDTILRYVCSIIYESTKCDKNFKSNFKKLMSINATNSIEFETVAQKKFNSGRSNKAKDKLIEYVKILKFGTPTDFKKFFGEEYFRKIIKSLENEGFTLKALNEITIKTIFYDSGNKSGLFFSDESNKLNIERIHKRKFERIVPSYDALSDQILSTNYFKDEKTYNMDEILLLMVKCAKFLNYNGDNKFELKSVFSKVVNDESLGKVLVNAIKGFMTPYLKMVGIDSRVTTFTTEYSKEFYNDNIMLTDILYHKNVLSNLFHIENFIPKDSNRGIMQGNNMQFLKPSIISKECFDQNKESLEESSQDYFKSLMEEYTTIKVSNKEEYVLKKDVEIYDMYGLVKSSNIELELANKDEFINSYGLRGSNDHNPNKKSGKENDVILLTSMYGN